MHKDQWTWLRSYMAAYCYYQNNEKYADTLGFLYNWYAVNSGKLCPAAGGCHQTRNGCNWKVQRIQNMVPAIQYGIAGLRDLMPDKGSGLSMAGERE